MQVRKRHLQLHKKLPWTYLTWKRNQCSLSKDNWSKSQIYQGSTVRKLPLVESWEATNPTKTQSQASTSLLAFSWKKVYLIPWTINGSLLHPPILKPSTLPPKLSKTGQITPTSGFRRRVCYSNTILSFSFLFISTKSLKIYRKS